VAIQITDTDPYHNTGKMWLGGGIHCPSVDFFTLYDQLCV